MAGDVFLTAHFLSFPSGDVLHKRGSDIAGGVERRSPYFSFFTHREVMRGDTVYGPSVPRSTPPGFGAAGSTERRRTVSGHPWSLSARLTGPCPEVELPVF